MNLLRSGLLLAAQNQWLAENLPRLAVGLGKAIIESYGYEAAAAQ